MWIIALKFLSIAKTFVFKNWKIIAIVLAVLAAFFYVNNLRGTIEDLIKKNTDLQVRLVDCQSNTEKLKHNIRSTNDKISQWKQVSEKLQAQNNNLTNALEHAKKETSVTVEKIMNEPSVSSCQEAINYLKNSREELQW